MHFECKVMEYGHWSTYKQTDPAPQADADITAMDAGPKKIATECKAAWTHKQREAYCVCTSSLLVKEFVSVAISVQYPTTDIA